MSVLADESEYKDDSEGLYKRWGDELEQAKKWFRKFHKSAEKVNKAFLDERRDDQGDFPGMTTRLNLFHSNTITLQSMLYGRIPKVEVSRRFADADDDVARVAGLILTRILNTDIEAAGEDIASVFRSGLQDRLLPGLGNARVKYQFEEKEQVTPAIMGPDGKEAAPEVKETVIVNEWTDTVYTHWQDILWSPARTHSEIRWKAYRSYLSKEKFKARFPEVDIDKVTFASKGPLNPKGAGKTGTGEDCYPQAEVWEIWDKDHRCCYWWTDGLKEILDKKEDPLGLEGFFPDPPPLIANTTTSKYIPKSDYTLAQDLYNEIDELETRITMLTRACKLVGVYDKANEGVKRIFQEGVENELIGVDNWAMFAEKGGLKGAIDWLPLEEVAKTIGILTEKQGQKIQQLYQVTGMNDVMRGAGSTDTRVSATQRKLEANYGSIRIEALQNEFARWVSDLQQLKAEIICKHYQPYCIKEQSNIMATPDAQFADAAIELLKDPAKSRWKILVRPETLAIADYAQLKQDRMEYIMGLAQFMQSAAPLVELSPESLPTLAKLLKWGLSGFRGSNEVEGILDQEISKLEKMPPKPKTDPAAEKAKAEAQKMQMEMQMEQQKMQAEMQRDREKHQADMQLAQQKLMLEQEKMKMELEKMRLETQMEIEALRIKLGLKVQEAQVDAQANAQEQAAQFAFNTAEREHEAKVSMESGDAELARDKQRAKLKPKSNGNGGSGGVRKSD